MGYHERNNLFLWLMFQPKIMDSHPFHLLCWNLEGLESMWVSWHPSNHEIFLGKMTHQPSHLLPNKKGWDHFLMIHPIRIPLLIGFFLAWRQVDVTLMHPELISISWLFKRCSQKKRQKLKPWNAAVIVSWQYTVYRPRTSQAADRLFSKSSKELPNCAPKPTRINENRGCKDMWDTQNLTLRFEDRNTLDRTTLTEFLRTIHTRWNFKTSFNLHLSEAMMQPLLWNQSLFYQKGIAKPNRKLPLSAHLDVLSNRSSREQRQDYHSNTNYLKGISSNIERLPYLWIVAHRSVESLANNT